MLLNIENFAIAETHTGSNATENSDFTRSEPADEESDPLDKLMQRLLSEKVRVKRMTSYYQKEFNVELVFLVDYSIYS